MTRDVASLRWLRPSNVETGRLGVGVGAIGCWKPAPTWRGVAGPRTGRPAAGLLDPEGQAGQRQRVLGAQDQAVDLQVLVVAVHARALRVGVGMVRVEAVHLGA